MECVKLLENPRLWDECHQTSPDTAEALRVTLSIMSGKAVITSQLLCPLDVEWCFCLALPVLDNCYVVTLQSCRQLSVTADGLIVTLIRHSRPFYLPTPPPPIPYPLRHNRPV